MNFFPLSLWEGVGEGKLKGKLTAIARELRNKAAEAEKYLWYVLRVKNLGVKFRRQAVIGRYIVDFVCFERRLIIEVDGGQHAESKIDKKRDEWFKREGYEVIRFWNNDVLNNQEGVISKINERLNLPSQTLPTRGREKILIKNL